jgi:hypothetical protein
MLSRRYGLVVNNKSICFVVELLYTRNKPDHMYPSWADGSVQPTTRRRMQGLEMVLV